MSDDVVFRRVSTARQSLDTDQIPHSLRALIPFAGHFGHPDLCHAEIAFKQASQQVQDEFKLLIERHGEELAAWLDENCRQGPPYPAAHARFSALRMLAETWES